MDWNPRNPGGNCPRSGRPTSELHQQSKLPYQGCASRTSSEVVGCLFEYQECFGTDSINPHGVGRLFGLHDLLEGFHVGHVHDQPYTVGVRGIGEKLARDSHGPEELLPLG